MGIRCYRTVAVRLVCAFFGLALACGMFCQGAQAAPGSPIPGDAPTSPPGVTAQGEYPPPAPSTTPAATPASTPEAAPATTPAPSVAPYPAASPKPGKALTAVKPRGFWYDIDARVMPETFDWFAPTNPSAKTKGGKFYGNGYSFMGLRIRGDVGYDTKDWQARGQLQELTLMGLPTHASAPSPAGNLGNGAAYYQDSMSTNITTLGIRQMYFHWGEVNKTGIQVGRFAYDDQADVPSVDPTLDWLKNQRISRHIFGGLDYTATDRSMTGGRIDLDTTPVHFDFMVVHPTQIDVHFADDLNLVTIFHGAITFKEIGLIPNGEGQIYFNHFDDMRQVAEIDDRPAKLRPNINLEGGNHITTLGFHYLSKIGQDGDAAVWYGKQTGQWGTRTQEAYAYQAELGLQLHEVPWQPWFRIGFSDYSGDPNPASSVHETFEGIAFDPRTKGMGIANTSNLKDLVGSIILQPRKETQFRLDVHELQLDNSHDLWYGGAGGEQDIGLNGIAGRPSGGYSDIGTFLEATLSNKFDDHNILLFHYLQLWGGNVVKFNFGRQSDAHQIYLEYHYLWQ